MTTPSIRRPLNALQPRGLLLAGAALLAFGPQAAFAQPQAEPSGSLYVEADSVSRSESGLVSASGEEERALAQFEGRSLRARQITYDLNSGVATAAGEAELIDIEGSVITASLLELDEDLRTGVAVDVTVRSPDGASLMAATAVRRSEDVNELNYALFTPCPLCDDDGTRKEPTWSIQAEQVVQDEALRAILYRNALFRVGGVPVLWLPIFAHPDPTVERASGFLTPTLDYDSARGVSYEQPYLIVVSPSQDWVISPQINTRVNPFLNLGWRRHFGDGIVQARAGYTYEDIFGDPSSRDDHRGFLLAHGAFDPDGPWRWGFTAERASDKTLFDRYDTEDPYQDNGLYYGDRRRLISQIYAERQTRRSYLSAAAFTIQSLRVLEVNRANPALNIFEDDGVTPVVAPLIEARWEPFQEFVGGRLRFSGTAAMLTRSDYIGAPVLHPSLLAPGAPPPAAPGLPGVDSGRATIQADWRRILISRAGLRWEPFVNVRGDAYAISDLPDGTDDANVTRGRATAGLNLSYPLVRRTSAGGSIILEPMAQFSASTKADLDPRIPNEDSHVIELDEHALFSIDRFPGQDLHEGGLRMTLGGRASMRWGFDRSASLFVGRSFRDERNDEFLTAAPDAPNTLFDPTGLADKASDWVVAATFSPSDRIRGWGHAQITDGGDIRRAEVAVDGEWGQRNLATVSYILDRSNPVPGPFNRNYEFVQAAGQHFVYGDWGLTGRAIVDIADDTLTRGEIGLLFEDDCIRFEIGYRKDNTRVDPSGPRTGVYVRLTLATLGSSGYQRDDMW